MAALSPGRRLVRLLTKSLPPNAEWTESEQATLGLIADSADRIEALKAHLAVELDKPEVSRRGIELAAEVRQLEANLVKMVALLDPEMSNGRGSRDSISTRRIRGGIVARLKQRGDEVGLREYFLEEAIYMRDTYGPKLPEAWDMYSRRVDRLIGGEEHGFSRYELPWDHPLRRARGPAGMSDSLVLTEDDELVEPAAGGGVRMRAG